MKFAEHLSAHITPEWRKQYINYEEMKKMLYSVIDNAPSPQDPDAEPADRYFAAFDETFFLYCDSELTKINTFYAEKFAEASRKHAALQSELQETLNEKHSDLFRNKLWQQNNAKKLGISSRKLSHLRLAFSEFYLSLILLQNYQNLNYTGFRKILKKRDKLLQGNEGTKWRMDKVEVAYFYTNRDTDQLIAEVESIVTETLEAGDRRRAMQKLRVPPLSQTKGPWTTFRVGLFSGFFITILLVVIVAISTKKNFKWTTFIRLFRGPMLLVQYLYLWALNVYGWRTSGVNHVLIFCLDPRNNLSEQHIAELAGALGLLWGLSALLYLFHEELAIASYIPPLIFYTLLLSYVLNPIKMCYKKGRIWLLTIEGEVVAAPAFPVTFINFWIAEQLNSLVPVILDFYFFIVFTVSSEVRWPERILAMLPAWWRCVQCMRRSRDTTDTWLHAFNALKYITSILIILLASFASSCHEFNKLTCVWFNLWLACALLSVLFNYYWDIKLDWGLLNARSDDPVLLREETVYSSSYYYYFGMVEDFLLRFVWAASISLTATGFENADIIVTILAPFELFRRFIWNFFRLENEHLNNCGNFRAVRDISIAPMDTGDQETILRMMDQP